MSAKTALDHERQERSQSSLAKVAPWDDLGLAVSAGTRNLLEKSTNPTGHCSSPTLPQTHTSWQQSVWWTLGLKTLGAACLLLLLAGVGWAAMPQPSPERKPSPAAFPSPQNTKQGSGAPSPEWVAPVSPTGRADRPPRKELAPPEPPVQDQAISATTNVTGIPQSGVATPQESPDARPAPAGSGVTADGKVILNLAQEADLRRLPGIGPKRAEAIIKLRERLGRFRKATDLLRIKGIGPKGLERIKPHFVLDPPAASPVEPSERQGTPT